MQQITLLYTSSTWKCMAKNCRKLKNSDFDMEVEAKAAFANLQKRYQKRHITLRRPEKLEQGSKEMEKPINGFKDHEFFQ